jgi:hypothetical protein
VREKVSGGIGGGVHCLFAFGSVHKEIKKRVKRRNVMSRSVSDIHQKKKKDE